MYSKMNKNPSRFFVLSDSGKAVLSSDYNQETRENVAGSKSIDFQKRLSHFPMFRSHMSHTS